MSLHPAASVFLGVLLGEIGEENRRLREDVARLRPLLDHVQKVELIAVTNEEPIEFVREDSADDTNVFSPAGKVTVEAISTFRLCDGTVKGLCGSERLVIPVKSRELLLRNLGFCGGIGLNMVDLDRSLGFYPHTHRADSRNFSDSALVHVEEGDSAHLTVFISDHISIGGVLGNLSNRDILKIKEGGGRDFISRHLFVSVTFFGETVHPAVNLTFKPTSISLGLTPSLKDKLSLIERATSSSSKGSKIEAMSPSDELRSLAIPALGDDIQKSMLDENRSLKRITEALIDIRERIMKVDISHPDGVLTCSLEDGKLVYDPEGNFFWRIDVWGKEHSSVAVSRIRDSNCSLSGIELCQSFDLTAPGLIQTEHNPLFGLIVPYSKNGVKVFGAFNWGDIDEDETDEIISNDFFGNLQRAMSSIYVSPARFPESFKLKLSAVQFPLGAIEHVLRMVGLDDGLDRIDGNAENDTETAE